MPELHGAERKFSERTHLILVAAMVAGGGVAILVAWLLLATPGQAPGRGMTEVDARVVITSIAVEADPPRPCRLYVKYELDDEQQAGTTEPDFRACAFNPGDEVIVALDMSGSELYLVTASKTLWGVYILLLPMGIATAVLCGLALRASRLGRLDEYFAIGGAVRRVSTRRD